AERKASEDRAKAIAAKAQAGTDLAALATAEKLEIKHTNAFDGHSSKIENVNDADLMPFRAEAMKTEKGKVSGVIIGPQGLYLAVVTEITPPVQKPLEAAHDDVKAAAIRKQKETPEYQKQVADYVGKILEKAKSIEDMKTMFPELDVQVKQSESFGLNDMLFQQGILMETRALMNRIVDKKPGDF